MPLLPNAPPVPGGQNGLIRLYERVMETLGSYDNTASFVGLFEDMNSVKANVSPCVYTQDRKPGNGSHAVDTYS